MLEHLRSAATDPARVVVLGAGGFVGGATTNLLKGAGVPVLALGRSEVDLLSDGAGPALASMLAPDDSLVVVSARAPCKNTVMLRENIAMMETVCTAIARQPVAHVVYISSDAVYGDEPVPLTEESPAAPGSIHGVMHLARELMLRECVNAPLAILRPTLIYGAEDPHNGYGPNRFRRQATAGENIDLFGEGEERRDHVLIDDVAELVVGVLRHLSVGELNLATGHVASFRDIAETIVSLYRSNVTVRSNERVGAMPHNGYRPFDPAATLAAFPDFSYTSLADGLARVRDKEQEAQHG